VFHLTPANVGGREQGFEALKAGVMREDAEMAQGASALVTPVRHVIKVEAVR
jgi:hypothetical protein